MAKKRIKLDYQRNNEHTTWWVTSPDNFVCAGSFIGKSKSGKTYFAMFDESLVGKGFRSLGAAKKAMEKAANK